MVQWNSMVYGICMKFVTMNQQAIWPYWAHYKHKLCSLSLNQSVYSLCECEKEKNTSEFHLWHIITKFASVSNSLALPLPNFLPKSHLCTGHRTFLFCWCCCYEKKSKAQISVMRGHLIWRFWPFVIRFGFDSFVRRRWISHSVHFHYLIEFCVCMMNIYIYRTSRPSWAEPCQDKTKNDNNTIAQIGLISIEICERAIELMGIQWYVIQNICENTIYLMSNQWTHDDPH